MDPDINTTDTTLTQEPDVAHPAVAAAAAPPSDPPPPAGKAFTQDQVNAMMAEARRKGREQGRGEAKSHTPAAQDNKPAATPPDALSEVQRLRADLQFRDVIADAGLILSAKQRDVLRAHFDPGSPESVVELAKEIYAKPALPPAAVPASPAPAAATPKGAQPGQAPAYVSPGSPTGSPDVGLESDPMTWTRDQIKAYEADKTFMPRIERWKATQPGGGGASLFPSRTPKR